MKEGTTLILFSIEPWPLHSNLNILHVEDEIQDQRQMHHLLTELGFRNLYQCRTIAEAKDVFDAHEIDLLILDILLEGSEVDGISYAKSVLVKTDLPILFTSSLSDDQTVSRTESIPDCEYIVKPVPERQLFVSLKKLFLRYLLTSEGDQAIGLSESSYFLVKTNSKFYVRINKDDLLYLEADKGGTIIYHTGGMQFVYIKLHKVIDQLMQLGIIRCHLSYAFAAKALLEYSDEQVILTSAKSIPVSRSYRKQVKAQLNKLIISNG